MVSYETQVTKDGRVRAPRMLFGRNYRKPFPWIRAGVGAAIMAAVCAEFYRRQIYVAPQEKFIRKIKVQPYGVLGTQMSLQGGLKREAGEPDSSVLITDPADLMSIFMDTSRATGASGAIYKWLGLTGPFPNDVVLSVTKVCDAKQHRYDGGKNVVHVIGPDFREGRWSEREAAIELSRAYRNLLHEFVVSECDTLRMSPISHGERSGPLYNQLPPLTHEALMLAFEQLHTFDREYVLRDDKHIDLCVFMNREWDMYASVFKNLKPSFPLAGR